MSQRLTQTEIEERMSKRPKPSWKYCQKCYENAWTRQFCKCPACRNSKELKSRMFVHINELNPATVDWSSYDKETDTYLTGVSDSWQLCDDCSRKYQVYASWES